MNFIKCVKIRGYEVTFNFRVFFVFYNFYAFNRKCENFVRIFFKQKPLLKLINRGEYKVEIEVLELVF